ncbi:type I secretion system permease/ATPase [Poseidonibacter ostreae]|uniref:Type I secretion system permease/ATPase n=1 Tax=Poseidonibacter ostreae TaxID=2654171 RepID=A0A6L4WNP7_9BACT|nr:type I secretion system permease/ATPase [Poseidonibacter ostreae]KAB7883025.1 type I secretion system permease/ATPase [Poseidonibacter ostreae]KAB7884912.1 type I secretion system permease/ATPase [Poseidonibacter ostreae]KAB7887394.1 type I secretion system permease/ATPase [Poseidonibacter ostreae]
MSLLNTLQHTCTLFGITISKEALIDGLTIKDNDIDIITFEKAANKAGIKTRKSHLKKFEDKFLPLILILNEGKVCIVKEIYEDRASVCFVEESVEEMEISLEELNQRHNGEVILLKKDLKSKSGVYKSLDNAKPKAWFYSILKDNFGIYIQVLLSAVFINLFVLASPLFTMNVYDRVVPNNAVDTLIVMAVGVCIVYFFDMILKIIRSWLIGFAGRKADAKIGTIIFNKLLNLKLTSKPAYSGTFANNLSGFESLREFFTSSTVALIVDLPFTFLFIWVIYFIGGAMAIVPVVTLIVGLAIAFLSQAPQRRYIQEAFLHDQFKQGLLLETITGLETVKSTGLHARMRSMWEESIDVLAHVNEKSHFLNSSINYILAFLNGISSVAIISIGVLGVSNGEITMGAIIAASLLNGRISAPVTQIVSLMVRLERSMLSLSVLNNFMKMPVEKDEFKTYLSRPDLKGELLFKNVQFRYNEESISVLNDLNLKINPNEKVAIIGRIGSGKSTLAKLAMNLYDPTDGSVLIDGTSASQIEPADLRKSIGYMPQDNFLFMGTIKDNITSGTNFIDDEKLIAAAKLSGVDNFTVNHEMGFDLEVGERGDGLSGGEKQAVALARAVVHEPNILVLDEPTSQMDNMTEAGIISRLQEFCQNRTLILITHKFSLLPLVDRIIIVDNGRVVDDGPKNVILEKLHKGKVRVNA